jgi:hypothetical protein
MCAMIATRGVGVYHHHEREVRADLLLRRNIEALLTARRLDAKALARWCGHKGPWISKILAGERGVQLDDLGKIADFFGLSVSQLFQHGISVPIVARYDRQTDSTSTHPAVHAESAAATAPKAARFDDPY